MGMATPVLLWFASFSNVTSIVVVALCFIAMTVFIGFVSLNIDSSGSSHLTIGIEERNMVKVSNPFFLHLDSDKRTLQGCVFPSTDGLRAVLSSLCPCEVVILWGPRINPLHDLILKPGTEVRRACRDLSCEMYRQLEALHSTQLQYLEPGEHEICDRLPESVSSESLGDVPRDRYPVAVLTFVPQPGQGHDSGATQGQDPSQNSGDSSEQEAGAGGREEVSDVCESMEDPNCIIGLVSIIHLQDGRVHHKSHVISQYIKTAGVALFSLKPLYMSSRPADAPAEGHSGGIEGHSGGDEGHSGSDEGHSGGDEGHRGGDEGHSGGDEGHRGGDEGHSGGISRNRDGRTNTSSYDSRNRDGKMIPDTLQNGPRRGGGKIRKRIGKGVHREIALGRSPDSDPTTSGRVDICQPITSGRVDISQPTTSGDVDISQPITSGRVDICQPITSDGVDISQPITFGRVGEVGRDVSPPGVESLERPCSCDCLPECVVCQTRRVRCVLLPCRHACVCLGCFKLLDKCPLCRGGLESYFLLGDQENSNCEGDCGGDGEGEDAILQELHQQAVRASLGQVWEDFHRRLYGLLGFR
ncbi:uncharacterized protein LOC101860534 [Aplysia californica]|uniref:Uncharacterized protein LOC101860534 n=1 Tax=Aplysia californica TaxID=6500 RepID=A0ABM1AC38_APLCA|nr:uncharacterized protein LOC101860534 [Aplysia californica]